MIVIHNSTSAVAVRVGLVDLPEEILEACVEALLPSLSECSPGFTIDTTPVSFPREIFALRLTSKLFHRIASPCAWRRLNIFVRYSRHFPSDYRAVFAKWNNLVEHPSILNHTRFLALEIHLDSPKISSAALRALIPTIGSLENLQVLRVKEGLFTGTTVDNHNVIHMIYTELLRQPRIHTLILESNVMPPSLHQSRSMENLRHLRVTIHAEPGWINALLQMTPRLEALSLCARKGVIIPNNLPIPWTTLREIEIRRIKNWQEIVDNFSVSRCVTSRIRSSLSHHSALETALSRSLLATVRDIHRN